MIRAAPVPLSFRVYARGIWPMRRGPLACGSRFTAETQRPRRRCGEDGKCRCGEAANEEGAAPNGEGAVTKLWGTAADGWGATPASYAEWRVATFRGPRSDG